LPLLKFQPSYISDASKPDCYVYNSYSSKGADKTFYPTTHITVPSYHSVRRHATQRSMTAIPVRLDSGSNIFFLIYIRFLLVILMAAIPLCVSLHKPHLFGPTQLRFILFLFKFLSLDVRYMFRPVFRPYIQELWKYFPSAYRQASRPTNTMLALRRLLSSDSRQGRSWRQLSNKIKFIYY